MIIIHFIVLLVIINFLLMQQCFDSHNIIKYYTKCQNHSKHGDQYLQTEK